MSLFGLKKTELWVTLALLLLCLSVCPHSTHPHVGEADETMDREAENVEHEEDDGEGVHDENEGAEEEADLGEDADVENAVATTYPGERAPKDKCKKEKESCTEDYYCCVDLYCKANDIQSYCDPKNKG